MLKIRLRRVGSKQNPKYRVVVADSRSPRDGRFVDNIGHYDPIPDPPAFTIDEEKAIDWLRKGAQPTDSVAKLLNRTGALQKVKGG